MLPLIISLGFDPIWYGVLYTITCQIAYMTPPFGYNLFLMRAMAPKEISLQDIYSSIVPICIDNGFWSCYSYDIPRDSHISS